MKSLPFILLLIAQISLFSCKKDEPVPVKGEEVLTSNKSVSGQTYSVTGFSFATASQVKYTLGGTESVDIILNEMIDQFGVPYDVYLSSPSNYEAFKLYGTYQTAQEAESAFTAYRTIDATSFSDKTGGLTPNTIYTYKSKDNKYAKILIMNVKLIETSGVTPFFSISLKWAFQPDGTTSFY